MTPRDFGPPTAAPRDYFDLLSKKEHESAAAPELLAHEAQGMGFLFGSERFGMRNEDVYRCHVALSIPTNPQFGSLNLASAIQVVAYEWRLALGGFGVQAATPPEKWADARRVAGMLQHLESALVHVDFLNPDAPKKLMPRLNQLFNRTQVTEEEIHILRGIAKAVLQASRKPKAVPSAGLAGSD
jgi:tRNA/rRNA methyltransferase